MHFILLHSAIEFFLTIDVTRVQYQIGYTDFVKMTTKPIIFVELCPMSICAESKAKVIYNFSEYLWKVGYAENKIADLCK